MMRTPLAMLLILSLALAPAMLVRSADAARPRVAKSQKAAAKPAAKQAKTPSRQRVGRNRATAARSSARGSLKQRVHTTGRSLRQAGKTGLHVPRPAATKLRLKTQRLARTAGINARGGTVVLGRYTHLSRNRMQFRQAANSRWKSYPGYYARVATKSGSTHFSVPSKVFNKWSKNSQWLANQKFLDRAVERRDSFRLSSRLSRAQSGSAYARELGYLKRRGYTLSKDGKWLHPPHRRRP